MLRQIFLSLIVVVVAAVLVVVFVPGARDTLARYGVVLPFGPEAPAAGQASAPGGGQGGGQPGAPAGGQGGGQGGGAQGGGGGQGGGRGGPRAAVVVTAPVVMATIDDKLAAIGEGTALNSVTLVSPAAGTLESLAVAPGDHVDKGAVIGKLDDSAERIALQKAQLAQSDADATLKRTKDLATSSAVTPVQLAAAQLASDNAALAVASAQLDLDKRVIVSPIAGTVGLFQVNPGNSLTTQSVVTTVEDNSQLRINFYVPERYASSISLGMEVDAEAVALPGLQIKGKVTAVDNKVDAASRTLAVEARVANDDGRLKPGMSFSVSMRFAGESFPAVDPLAIQWSSTGSYVWRLNGSKVERVDVTIIQRNSDGVLVKGPLAAGDPVVTQGVQQLTAGMTVRLLDAPASPDGGKGGGAGNGGDGSANPGKAPASGSAAPASTEGGGKKTWTKNSKAPAGASSGNSQG